MLAARKERAARLLLLTKSFGCWKAFAAASRSSRRCGDKAGWGSIRPILLLVFDTSLPSYSLME